MALLVQAPQQEAEHAGPLAVGDGAAGPERRHPGVDARGTPAQGLLLVGRALQLGPVVRHAEGARGLHPEPIPGLRAQQVVSDERALGTEVELERERDPDRSDDHPRPVMSIGRAIDRRARGGTDGCARSARATGWVA